MQDALCQAAQIVPIVEPEVLMGRDIDLLRGEHARLTFRNCGFSAHSGHDPETNIYLGKKCAGQSPSKRVARNHSTEIQVPAGASRAFLSGGQSDTDATAHLDAMNRIGGLPWRLTFSYGRALQAAPQKAWSGKAENAAAGQRAFAHRARMNSLASNGEWQADLEKQKAA